MKHRYRLISVSIIVILFFIAATLFNNSLNKQYLKKERKSITAVAKYIVSKMNSRKLRGQLFMMFLKLDDFKTIKKFYPGGIFIHPMNIPGHHQANLPLLRKKIDKINRYYDKHSMVRPFFSIDQEGGLVRRITKGIPQFTSNMAMSEAVAEGMPKQYIEAAAYYNCRSLKSLGINWNLAPVVDVQNNPENPIIRTRSFSSNATLVATYGALYMRGLKTAGCIGSLKHFPGHGDTHLDSHKRLPVVKKKFKTLQKTELLPYKRIITSGDAETIMSAHIMFKKQHRRPATISKYWLTQVLRKQLHFKGVIISDDMGMRGIFHYLKKKKKRKKLAYYALSAGIDLLLIYNRAKKSTKLYMKQLRKKMKKSKVFKATVREKVIRLVELKIHYGLLFQQLQWLQKQGKTPVTIQNSIAFIIRRQAEKDKAAIHKAASYPSVKKINTVSTKLSIKRLIGSHVLKKPIVLYTDISIEATAYDKLKKTYSNIQPLDTLDATSYDKNVSILHVKDISLSPLIIEAIKNKSAAWQIYTAFNVFPYAKYGKPLNKNDLLVTSFSNTHEAVAALIDVFLKKELPPLAIVKYKN